MTKVVYYARFSTELQSRASIEDQFRTCRQKGKLEGWKEVGTYHDEAISGYSIILRPGIRQLLEDAQQGKFDMVVTEALDRLSRDQADAAMLFKLLKFAGVRIHTLAEGDISELHIGFKGTMNAIFLSDLTAKVRRGMAGLILNAKSGGGLCYGYDVVRKYDEQGQPIRGERAINQREAEVVCQIFCDFAAGVSPFAIARRLNEQGVPPPRGKLWTDGTIRGHILRGTGIINNELYIGRLIWNRQRYVKDPSTGKRVSRRNSETEWIITQVPALRIIDDELWQAAKNRQRIVLEQYSAAVEGVRKYHRNHLNGKRRPKYLLSGLVFCGCCGGHFSLRGANRFACSTRVNGGSCSNHRTILRDALERRVLTGLKDQMLEPEATAEALRAFAEETNRFNQERRSKAREWQLELTKIEKQMENILVAITDGMYQPSLKERMTSLEYRKKELSDHLSAVPYDAPKVLSQASEAYARKVSRLTEALNQPEERAAATEVLRSLIEKIVITPGLGRGDVGVKLYGELGTILDWSNRQAIESSSKKDSQCALGDRLSASVVAGAGFEPAAFRL
ncbi:recombinase family protein [Rhizobium sp. BK399]|uniref:recombinase family protein n=1 Tax=Rhizobium sp. BK399 TaxID=2587063 RepID=UPI00162150B6|nr:recombinase family protein [Rhizobium sp. BK399]